MMSSHPAMAASARGLNLTRRLRLPSGETVLLTDTVGFIQKLPTGLVAAFRATLEELEDADLLLHVLDISHPHSAEHAQVVSSTLQDLGVVERPTILALNKVDCLEHDGHVVKSFAEAEETLSAAGPGPMNVVPVSATKGWGLDDLLETIESGIDGALDVTPPALALAGIRTS